MWTKITILERYKEYMKAFYLIILLITSYTAFSQRGKDGVGNITLVNTVVNAYTPLTVNVSAGTNTLTVASSAAYSVGDLVMIIQMQGASALGSWDNIAVDINSSIPTNTTNGNITSYNNSGNNEFAQVSSIPNSTTIVLDCGLQYSYDVSKVYMTSPNVYAITVPGNVQVIRVPRYTTLTVSGAGSITCPQWDGSTGGVVAVEVQTNATLSSIPSFNAAGKGFRGGAVENSTTFGGNKWGSLQAIQGGYKGESIAGDTNVYKSYAGVFGRGAMANGGGGGCAHNAGGGGGANGGIITNYNGYGNTAAGYTAAWNLESAGFATNTSSGGGRGGYTFSSSNQNVATKAPGNTVWGGDNRDNVGGMGGRPLDSSTGRLFMGGGGGAGDANDGYGRPGGNGGGLVYMMCYGNLSGSGTIVADGAAALNTINSGIGCTGKDGASGGGGGGTIILNVAGSISMTAGTALSATGGKGGNQNYGSGCTSTEAYGPGGGGGGGYIASSGTLPSNNKAGGVNGIVTGNLSNVASNFPPNGATSGGAGSNGTAVNYTLTTSPDLTVCANQSFTVNASSTQPGASINWFNAIAGGTATAAGTTYTVPGYSTAGTYTLYAGACPGTYRQPIIVTVTSGLSISSTSATVCAGSTITITASGATTYTWNTGANTNTISVSPSSTTIYTVNGTTGSCTGTGYSTVTVNAAPVLTVNASPGSICSGQSSTLTVTGASTYTWSNGPNTSSQTVSPSSSTTYSVSGTTAAGCTNTLPAAAGVSVIPTPTISVNNATICPGQSAILTPTSSAASYSWSTSQTTNTISVSPASTTVYTVTGTTGLCSGTRTATVTVNPGLSISVNNPTICPGQSAILTPTSSATSYTWNTSQTTNTISVSPATTTSYTVTGTNAVCSGTQTAMVTVSSNVAISLASATICTGTGTVLTASGATTYTWNTGATTNTLNVSPATTTVYTVTGSISTCTGAGTSTVTVNALPSLSITAIPATVCAGQSATLTASGANTYTWSNGPTTATQTVSPGGSTTYSVSGTSVAGCLSTVPATVNISITPIPTVSVNSATICPGQSVVLTPTSSATSYSWSTSQTTNTISVSPAGTTVYTVTGANGLCSGVQTATVTVGPNITITVNSPTICAGTNTLLTASGANTYTWSTGDNTNAINVNPASTTVYTISGSIGTCTGSSTSTVSVDPGPSLTLTASPPNICTGQSTTLTAVGAATYTWSNIFFGSSQTVSPGSTIMYSVIGKNSAGCTSTTPATITVNVTATPTISANSATICAGQSASLTANGITSYTWSTGETTQIIHPSPNTTTTYTISGSNGGCASDATAIVTVNPSPALSFIPSNTTGCSTLCVNFNDLISPSSSTVFYNFGDGSTGNVSNPSHCYTNTGSYTVSTTATDPSNGCSSNFILPGGITVTPKPVALFSIQEGTLVTEGSTIHLINNSTNAVSYIWTACNSSYATTNVTTAVSDTGKCCISLLATSGAGCKDTITKCIEVINNATINIPNVITPNNDAKNDLFSIKTSGIKSLNCSIFDRWGLKMYEWDGINGYWDGKTKAGAAAVDGSYFYIINYTDFKDVSKTEKGFLSLFRN